MQNLKNIKNIPYHKVRLSVGIQNKTLMLAKSGVLIRHLFMSAMDYKNFEK